MKLFEINSSGPPSQDDLLKRAFEKAQPAEIQLSFYELPEVVQHAVLAEIPYEDILKVVITKQQPPIFIIIMKDRQELAFNPDGTKW